MSPGRLICTVLLTYLGHHGVSHIHIGLVREWDHQVINVVPALRPHVSYRNEYTQITISEAFFL